jgi:hypothetical protein
MGYLQQHSGTIAGFVIRAFGAPVFHPFQNFKAPLEYGMGRAAFNIGDKAYPAGIVFILFPVKAEAAQH